LKKDKSKSQQQIDDAIHELAEGVACVAISWVVEDKHTECSKINSFIT